MKKYINVSFIYAIAAIVSGVFYREFTKILGFSGKTTLAFTHLHLFALGALVFLLVAIFSAITNIEQQKQFGSFFKLYNISLPFVVIMFYVRGILQVLGTPLSKGANAAVSGIAGIAHVLFTVALVLLFIALKKSEINENLK